MITAGRTFGAAAANGFMAAVALRGPGALQEDDVPRALIFDAGKHCGVADALVQFYAEEMPALDWLRDYVMDENLKMLDHDLDDRFQVEEEMEQAYNKSDLTTVATDGDWAEG